MLPVVAEQKSNPAGYRPAGSQLIRVDLAEKILRSAFEARSKAGENAKDRHPKFALDLALPISIGLEDDNARRLFGSAGFRVQRSRPLAEGAFGPIQPDSWTWRPRRPGETLKRSPKPEERRGKPKGKRPPRGKGNRPPPKPEGDHGPARAGGAFDGLADLLRG